jgi:Na+-driven multidrug efflux pump
MKGTALCALAIYGAANLAPVWLIGRFTDVPGAVAVGVQGLLYFIPAGLFLGWLTVLGSALGGAGDGVSPMVANISSLWLLQLPICWLLTTHWPLGPQGIWIGLIAGYLAGTAGLMAWWRKGRWQHIRL